MSEETETPKSADVAGRLDDLVKFLDEFKFEIEERCKRDYRIYSHRVVTKTYRLIPNAELRREIRQAVADYMYSEGCGCCRDYDAHKLHTERLGKLLKVSKYDDGSGRNFSKYIRRRLKTCE